jgi:hypothetical protein
LGNTSPTLTPTAASPRERTRFERIFRNPRVRVVAWVIVGLVLTSGIVGGIHRGLENQPDWRDFARESRHVWDHGTIPISTAMFGYLPAAFFALWPFTIWPPAPWGLIAFVACNVVACLGSGWILYRGWFAPSSGVEPPGGSCRSEAIDRGAFVWPVLIVVAHAQHVLQANQLTLWVLLLCVTGLTLLMYERDVLGGIALGLGVCLKVTPGVFLVYLALRRQWKALAAMVFAIAAFDVAPSVVAFGVDGAIREHQAWLRRADWYSNRRLIEEPHLRIRRHGHNCAWSVVLGRWLRPAPDADYQVILHGDPPADIVAEAKASLAPNEYLVLDPMPTEGTVWSKTRDAIPDVPRMRIANLSARTVLAIWLVTLAVPIGLLCFATHRSRGSPRRSLAWAAEAALWMLLMFWPSPMVRDYYLALALPACVVVARFLATEELTSYRRTRAIGLGSLSLFFAGVVCMGWNDATFYGLHLVTLAALSIACAVVWRTTASHAARTLGGKSA